MNLNEVISCLASETRWRNSARLLREMAAAPYLTPAQSATLSREADASDRQADMWQRGAREARGGRDADDMGAE